MRQLSVKLPNLRFFEEKWESVLAGFLSDTPVLAIPKTINTLSGSEFFWAAWFAFLSQFLHWEFLNLGLYLQGFD